jgi:demethylmenaquinone methyltransferase/2-methoxy-6-polyprenyl-1,4-benzoquinol methylase
MNTEAFANSKIVHFIFKAVGVAMESRLRYRFFGPMVTLRGADMQPGQTVLEVGCGTGFYTVPLAKLIGDQGCVVAMDVLPVAVERTYKKVQKSNLKNVRVVKGDAMNTGLDAESMDVVLLFGVIPAPILPLNRLLPEMHRILKPQGTLAVWPPIPGFLPKSILRSGLFTYHSKRKSVYNFRRFQAAH